VRKTKRAGTAPPWVTKSVVPRERPTELNTAYLRKGDKVAVGDSPTANCTEATVIDPKYSRGHVLVEMPVIDKYDPDTGSYSYVNKRCVVRSRSIVDLWSEWYPANAYRLAKQARLQRESDRKYKMKEFQAAYVRETINTHTPLHVDAVDNRFSRGWVVRLDFSTFDEVVEWVQKMTGYGIDWSQCPVSTEPEPEPK
jgi:hypothetical protein